MADGKTEWPQDLKDFANRVFASCTDSNRKLVSEELRKVIFDAFQANALYSTDWANVQLKSLGGGGGATSTPKNANGKKRLLSSSSSSLSSPASSAMYDLYGTDSDDVDKREKRARRFENEQRRFQEDQDSSWSPMAAASAGETSLAGRLGVGVGVGVGSSTTKKKGKSNRRNHHEQQHQQQQQFGWTYDTTPSTNGSAATAPLVDDAIADPNVIDWDRDTVVGLSTRLEKPYLRLTSAPDPKTVRPLPILQQTLELLKRKWRAENNYAYICDQFKSMRQDLTVQRIKNEFTVKVYEIHARIALERGDLGEYNQCQSQLRSLYGYGIPGSKMEFLAYRILYLLHTRNRREITALMAELTPESKADPAVHHALRVRSSLAEGNYHRFFKLFLKAPNMNAYIMDHFVERERVVALSVMARSYRPSLPLSYISSELAFKDEQEAHDFLAAHNIAAYIDPTPSEAAAAAAAAVAAASSKHAKKRPPPTLPPLVQRKWDCKAALPGIVAAGEKYRKIDIKGQI